MKKLSILATLAAMSLYSDPGIMIDIDVFIEHPTGKPEVEMGCR